MRQNSSVTLNAHTEWLIITVYLFIAARLSTYSYEPCLTEDCGSQLIFPVLATRDEQPRYAVRWSTDGRVTHGRVQDLAWKAALPAAVAAADERDGDVWPVSTHTATDIIISDNKWLNNDNSALTDDDYNYDDNGDYQVNNKDKVRDTRTAKSSANLQLDNTFTGKFGVCLCVYLLFSVNVMPNRLTKPKTLLHSFV